MRYKLNTLTLSVAMVMIHGATTAQFDTWTQQTSLPSDPREDAVSFSINGKGYVGTGFYGGVRGDFWEFDPATDQWTQKAPFGGDARDRAAAFVINGKGYVATGYAGFSSIDDGRRRDLWEYDPVFDTWTRKADLPGEPRCGAVGFAIDGKGYIATGGYPMLSYLNDLWEYDPEADSWTEKAALPAAGRLNAIAFTIGPNGYVGTGNNGSQAASWAEKDLWAYDPTSNSWTQRADLPGNGRVDATAGSVGAKGYVCGGIVEGVGETGELLEFSPTTNTWTPKSPLTVARSRASAFSIGATLFVGTGSSTSPSVFMNDLWAYSSDGTVGVHEPTDAPLMMVYPNPIIGDHITIDLGYGPISGANVEMIDAIGRCVARWVINGVNGINVMSTADLSNGQYIVRASDLFTGMSVGSARVTKLSPR